MMATTWAEIKKQRRVAVIVAHPDDEVLGLGSQLAQFKNLVLIHVTDGVTSRHKLKHEKFAQKRLSELDSALLSLGASPSARALLHAIDQEVICSVANLVHTVMPLLAECDVVITHPYEGGHPDHDACALLAYAACALLELENKSAPVRVEFASYHMRRAQFIAGKFWENGPEHSIILDAQAQVRKRSALDYFESAREMISRFPLDAERVRFAPIYRFAQPPPPNEVQYDSGQWYVDGKRWRKYAREALTQLNLEHV